MAPNFSLATYYNFHPTKQKTRCFDYLRQAVVARVKAMGLPPGLDTLHVAQALGEGRGSQADLVVAVMESKGTGRIDFYEVRYTHRHMPHHVTSKYAACATSANMGSRSLSCCEMLSVQSYR